MKIDTEGTYTLRYTAEDECGNVTTEDRTVNAINITYRTALYTDGTFIINEKSTDIDANIAKHGRLYWRYRPFDPSAGSNYVFTSGSSREWKDEAYRVTRVEIGSKISPTSTAYWFYGFNRCTDFDLANLDTKLVTNMTEMFDGCSAMTSIDVSGFDTSSVTNMYGMFYNCTSLTVLDLSSFDTSSVTITQQMFGFCQNLATIYVSELFVVSQVITSTSMFTAMSSNLVGGAGTRWASSNPKDKTYAHIDGGTSNPGYFTAKS